MPEQVKSPLADQPTTGTPHGHEERDINLRAVMWFALALAVLIAIGLFVTWGVLAVLDEQAEGRKTPVRARGYPMEPPPTPLPGPKLLPDPALEMREEMHRVERLLSTYGWIDEEMGVARIPIERAMELALEDGFEVAAGHEVPETAAPGAAHEPPEPTQQLPPGTEPAQPTREPLRQVPERMTQPLGAQPQPPVDQQPDPRAERAERLGVSEREAEGDDAGPQGERSEEAPQVERSEAGPPVNEGGGPAHEGETR